MRHSVVIGAGLAGAAVCERLCSRGWQVDLIEQHAEPAREASGNYAGSFHPLIARDDNRLARLTQAGVAYALNYWRELEAAGHSFSWSAGGALQLSRADGKADPVKALEAGCFPTDYARRVTRAEASDLAGVTLNGGGVWFGAGGWVRPASLVRAQLERCVGSAGSGFRSHFGSAVATAEYYAGQWELADRRGHLIARAPVVVLAGGASDQLPLMFAQRVWPVASVRGQVSLLPANVIQAPRVPVHRDGYVLPAIDGRVVLGATYERAASQTAEQANAANLARLVSILDQPALVGNTQAAKIEIDCLEIDSRVAYRAVARDRLPVIGGLPDWGALDPVAVMRAGARVSHLPRLKGVYVAGAFASRGLTWAALAAAVVAAQIEGRAMPLEKELLDAVDPARFALHAVRRGLVPLR